MAQHPEAGLGELLPMLPGGEPFPVRCHGHRESSGRRGRASPRALMPQLMGAASLPGRVFSRARTWHSGL